MASGARQRPGPEVLAERLVAAPAAESDSTRRTDSLDPPPTPRGAAPTAAVRRRRERRADVGFVERAGRRRPRLVGPVAEPSPPTPSPRRGRHPASGRRIGPARRARTAGSPRRPRRRCALAAPAAACCVAAWRLGGCVGRSSWRTAHRRCRPRSRTARATSVIAATSSSTERAAGPRSPDNDRGRPTTMQVAPTSAAAATMARWSSARSAARSSVSYGLASTPDGSVTASPIRRSPRSTPRTRPSASVRTAHPPRGPRRPGARARRRPRRRSARRPARRRRAWRCRRPAPSPRRARGRPPTRRPRRGPC